MASRAAAFGGLGLVPLSPAARSRFGLDWLNFFVANFQTGFGPFISVYLTAGGWTQGAIGAALSVGTVTAVVGQVPAGALVDALPDKGRAAAVAIAAISASAVTIAAWPVLLPIMIAEIAHAFASAVLGPAIAAISLVLADRAAFGERLGRNARYAALGNAFAAALMGACGYLVSNRAVFLLTAALGIPALFCLRLIRRPGPAPSAAPPAAPGAPSSWHFAADRRFLAFALCAFLFHLANAAMLPIAAAAVTKRAGGEAPLLIAACLVGPQAVTALISPWAGRAAQLWGRRPVLLLGFGALPIRGLLFAAVGDPFLLIAIQLLDGLGAAVFGVLFPLVVADITAESGHYTTALGAVGLAIGGGATLSTAAAGLVADHFGDGAAFLGLVAVGFCATLAVLTLLPETRPAAFTPAKR
ncbi:MAG TPA: MFS transporter [Stellaceae bacterium]|nr:MFS transporter [Stellaceae bacterium]